MSKQKTSSTPGIIAHIAGYSASAGAGLLSMWANIRNDFANNKKKAGWYGKKGGPVETRDKEYAAIERLNRNPTIEEEIKIGKNYSQAVSEINAARGFGGATASINKFRVLTKGQQVKVLGIAVTVATVAIGAIQGLREKKRIADALEELNHRNDAESPRAV